jgi:hypothetical protein
LSEQEATLLKDLLDWWIEGFEEATTAVEADRTLETPEQLVEAVQGMHEQFDRAVTVRSRLWSELEKERV